MSVSDQNPRDSNTGVTPPLKQEISWTLDWLQFTIKGQNIQVPDELKDESEPCHGSNGYTDGIKQRNGIKIMTNPARPDMGTHILMTGDCLRQINQRAAAKWAMTASKITRLDVAVDIIDYGWKVEMFRKAAEEDKIHTKAQDISGWEKWRGKGTTVYIGRKSSKRMTKFYDKGAETGLGGDWWRAETTFKHPHSMKALQALENGTATAAALIKGHVDIDEEWYQEVMSADPVVTVAGKPDSKTKRWLLRQAAPALARIMREDDDHEFYLIFVGTVKQLYEDDE